MARVLPPSGRGYALDRDAIVGGRDRACTGRRESVSVAELLVRPWNHAEVYYRKPEGLPSPELICLRAAIGPLRHCGLRSDPGCNPFQLSPSCRGSPKRVNSAREREGRLTPVRLLAAQCSRADLP